MDPAFPRVAGEGIAVVIVPAAPTAGIIITDIGPAADAIAIMAATIDVGDLHPAAVTLGRASTGVHRSLRTTITVTVIVAAVSAAIAAVSIIAIVIGQRIDRNRGAADNRDTGGDIAEIDVVVIIAPLGLGRRGRGKGYESGCGGAGQDFRKLSHGKPPFKKPPKIHELASLLARPP